MNVLARTLVTAGIAFVAGCAGLPHDEPALARRDAATADIDRSAATPEGEWPDADWWKQFGDPALDALVERALAEAPNLATASARIRLAERSAEAARAELGVNSSLDASLAREKLSHNGLIPPPYGGMTIWDAEAKLGVNYDFDWWGKNRATLAAAVDEKRAAEADRAAAALVLASSVAQQYFSWQSSQARIELARKLVAEREELARLLRLRLQRGLESSASVAQADAAIETARQDVAALELGQRLVFEQLRALIGAAPGTLAPLAPTSLPAREAGVPPTLGLDLLARRPEIEAARLRIESQIRRVESAKAEFYPDVNLSAFLGLSSVRLSQALTAHSLTAGVMPALHLPLFDAGRLRAKLGVTRANLDVAIASYNQAVADAASEVSTQAATLAGLAEERKAAERVLAADIAIETNAQTREHRGVADTREVIAADIGIVAARDALAQLDGQRLQAEIALIKSLGGGYRAPSNEADAAASAP
ncbi:MAG TPA: efflux transporter outer membrane subunit [Rudaea sp.]|nr:efflux transporter outer membrane subunit [Rudaea sp.]